MNEDAVAKLEHAWQVARVVQAVVAIGAGVYAVLWLMRQDDARRAWKLAAEIETENNALRAANAKLEHELDVAYTPAHEQPEASSTAGNPKRFQTESVAVNDQ